jgi:hypothetical protein
MPMPMPMPEDLMTSTLTDAGDDAGITASPASGR